MQLERGRNNIDYEQTECGSLQTFIRQCSVYRCNLVHNISFVSLFMSQTEMIEPEPGITFQGGLDQS